jgi:hypothetical protein
MLDDLEQKYQQLITAKKWERVGHIGMDKSSKSAFNAAENHKDEAESYAAYIKNRANKGFLPFDDWAKLQTCHHCGNKGHVRPRCREYLAAKANGTLPPFPPSSEKRSNMPASAPPKDPRDKLQKDPKLKALLSAFSAFIANYLAELQPDENGEAANDNEADDVENVHDDNDDVNAFLGMVGALKEKAVVFLVPTIAYYC